MLQMIIYLLMMESPEYHAAKFNEYDEWVNE